jgi:2-C-methyl-D-erythritol 2,4-cyclodiphosphate synthase
MNGLLAHSGGDVALRTLRRPAGALALGDIGKHFPPTDERWRNEQSRSAASLRRLVAARGYATAL